MKHVAVHGKTPQKAAKSVSAAPPGPIASGQKVIDVHLRENIDPGRRLAMVADAAYFYAEHRGFEPGHELEDWLAAESQIDAALRLSEMQAATRTDG